MTTKRDMPYVWVTWVSGILAGDSHCEWAAWFKAHYVGYAKQPLRVDLLVWKAEHGAKVRARADALRDTGYKVYVENQNKFTFKGSGGITLAGTPDIVAVKRDDVLVVDCKTGKERASDVFQVLLYMLVLPRTHAGCGGKAIRGEVEYKERVVDVGSNKLTQGIKDLIRGVMGSVGGAQPPMRTPSFAECQFCDLTRADCSERVEVEQVSATTENGTLF